MREFDVRADPDLELRGYSWTELLHRGARSLVVRGIRDPDSQPVVAKITAAPVVGRVDRARLEREHEVLRRILEVRGAPHVLALERNERFWALVTTDGRGQALDRLAIAGPIPLEQALELALDIVDVIHGIHERGITHGAVAPEHIILNQEARSVSLIDFSHAMVGPQERGRRTTYGSHGASLAYAAPEQTGRMNRTVDHRSDYYSLGVVLFELTTGRLPFGRGDALELVHAHIAKSPPGPRELNPRIPPALARLILKLLSKDADERYQSRKHLRVDLERCRIALARGESEFDFPLAIDDRPEHYRIPQKLYGRAAEVSQLSAALERAITGRLELTLLSGEAGSGKTELAREMSRVVSAHRGYFATGKFDQYERSRPYPAMSLALESLSHQLLTESPERLSAWTQRVLKALPTTAQVLIELCPALEFVLGPQPAVAALEGQAARNRLHQCLTFAIRAIATPDNPLCLCLDDIQWAGPDSIVLLRELVTNCRQSALHLILTHRTASASSSTPGSTDYQVLLRRSDIAYESIELRLLSAATLTELVGDALSMSLAHAQPLAEIVFTRTAGNPYYVHAFLDTLYADGMLARAGLDDPNRLGAIRGHPATENVVDLLLQRIHRLPIATQNLLKMAGCLGSRFDHEILAAVAGASFEEDLKPALDAELLGCFEQFGGGDLAGAPPVRLQYHFAHNRVQQAALSLIDPALRSRIHLEVGTRLYDSLQDAAPPSRLFEICVHFNRGLSSVATWEQRRLIATLDLRTAKLAVQRAAGVEAIELAQAGIVALGDEGWSRCYELIRDLHLFVAETAFAWADYDTLQFVGRALLAHSRTSLDSVRLWRLEGRVHQAQARGLEAIRVYRRALAALGVDLPETATNLDVNDEMRLTAEALRGRTRDDLVGLPTCEDAGHVIAMELLSKLVFFAYSTNHPLLPIVICRLVRFSVQHGNCAESANGYTFYGYLLARDHDLEEACNFGRLALALAHRFDDAAVLSQTYLYAHYQLLHWTLPPSELAVAFETAHRYGFESGSPLTTACSVTTLCICRFWAGEPLESLARDMAAHRDLIVSFRQALVLDWHEVLMQTIANLRVDNAEPTLLAGPIYDERVRLPSHEATGARSAISNHGVAKILLLYLLGDEEAALEWAERNQGFERHFTSAIWSVPVLFMDSLCRLAAYDRLPERREELTEQVTRNCQKLASWLPYNRQHLSPKLKTVQAELARIRGDRVGANVLYTEAFETATSNGAYHEAGIAAELAGRFYTSIGEGGLARSYLRRAHRAYFRWGANAKVKALERKYPHLIPTTDVWATDTAGSNEIDGLDLLSVLHASQVISSEVKLDRLLSKLMSLLLESAGAQTAHLLFETSRGWLVQAGLSADAGLLTMLESLPLESYVTGGGAIVSSVVHYVGRTSETLTLEDATVASLFANDPQVKERGVRSLLAFPLHREGHRRVLVYLENNLVRGAFTTHSATLLALLSSQAAISLENARLYAGLEDQVADRTRQLQERNDELKSALDRLVDTQRQLVAKEKLAALGAVTAGIAHEIKNPMNFVTNFADISYELAGELAQHIRTHVQDSDQGQVERSCEILGQLSEAARKVVEHSARASSVIHRMAQHAVQGRAARTPIDLNSLVAQSVDLANQPDVCNYVVMQCEPGLGDAEIVVSDINRVLINLIQNARHSVEQKQRLAGTMFEPRVIVSTHNLEAEVEIRVLDNGIGIEPGHLDKIFVPFFTTKPTGQGTGLGLSISHDIVVREHRGKLNVRTESGHFCEFSIVLPRRIGA